MTKVTPQTIGQYLLKNWKNIILIIFLLIFVYQCNGNRDLELANSTLKKQAEVHLENARLFEQKNVALQKDFEKLSDSVTILKENEKKIIASREVIKQKSVEKIAKIRQFNSSQIAKYVQERYGVDSTKVKTTIEGTEIKDDVAIDVLSELEQGDSCIEEVKNLESQIEVKNEIEKKKDEQIVNVLDQNNNLSLANIELEKANELTNNALENAEKAFRQQKGAKTFWKITTFAVVVSAITKGIIDNK
jgi:hypothetical protein